MTTADTAPLLPSDVIARCGGAKAIAERAASGLTIWAVYRWQRFGIPDRHWPLLVEMGGLTPDELFAANKALRSPRPEAAE